MIPDTFKHDGEPSDRAKPELHEANMCSAGNAVTR